MIVPLPELLELENSCLNLIIVSITTNWVFEIAVAAITSLFQMNSCQKAALLRGDLH